MSGIAGAVAWDCPREDSAALVRAQHQLLAALAHRGTAVRWQDSECALGALLAPTTPESHNEQQPLVDAETGCVLVWDGRLDNRSELHEALPGLSPQAPDAEFALRAFLKWREDSAARLLGDFAFAVWDPRSHALFAARDPLGLRPLFYSPEASGRLYFATEFQALLRLPEVPREPDEVTVSEYLLWWTAFPDVERTFFRAIRRLPPAHWLRWSARGLELHRYWAINPRRRLRYARHEDYAEEFHALLTQAVRCRLRATQSIGIFLSGGMDSGAVATLAGRLAGRPGALYAYCSQLPDDDPYDETSLAEDVARRAGIPFRRHPLVVGNFIGELGNHVRQHAIPFVDLAFHNDMGMLRRAVADGCGAIFTGDGGDELFNFPWAYVADLVRGFRVRKLLRELGPYSRYNSRGPLEMLKFSSRYIVPQRLLRAWKILKWRKAPAWVHPDFARRTDLVERLRWVRPQLPFDSISANEDYFAFTRGRRILVDERREHEAAPLGLHYRYPFYDVRLLEFMLAVPWEEKVTQGRMKSFLREIPSLLPERVATLREKANYNSFSNRQLRAQDWTSLRELFVAPPARAADYVDLRVARRVSDAFLERDDWGKLDTFLGLAGLFLWLRELA